MIIQILANLIDEGYLKKENQNVVSPFFAGTNVAFRKQAITQLGPYDEYCRSGEDQDICLRLANTRWEQYYEPKSIVRHKNKMSFRVFTRKWLTYGFYHPYLFRKHGSKGLKIYKANQKSKDQSIYTCLLDTKFPFHIWIFVTPFLTMHILFLLTILLLLAGLNILAFTCGFITLIVAVRYFWLDIKRKNVLQGMAFVSLRYIANLALWLGGFTGGIKFKMLYISGTLDYKS